LQESREPATRLARGSNKRATTTEASLLPFFFSQLISLLNDLHRLSTRVYNIETGSKTGAHRF
jgi:hypothetical protein